MLRRQPDATPLPSMTCFTSSTMVIAVLRGPSAVSSSLWLCEPLPYSEPQKSLAQVERSPTTPAVTLVDMRQVSSQSVTSIVATPVRAHTLACASQVTLPRRGSCGSPGPTSGHRRIAGRENHPCEMCHHGLVLCQRGVPLVRPDPVRQSERCVPLGGTDCTTTSTLCNPAVLSSCAFNWLASSARRCSFAKSRPPPLPGTPCLLHDSTCPAA